MQALPEGSLEEDLDSSQIARLREHFLPWWHTSLECLVSAQKLFRRLDDDDLTAIYLAAWSFALEHIEATQRPAPGGRVIEFLTQCDPEGLQGESLARFAEVTGIPRETVRRKL